jgi:hypothetical protein
MSYNDVVGYHLHPEIGGNKVLLNVSILPHHYSVTQLRRSGLEPSSSENLRSQAIVYLHVSSPKLFFKFGLSCVGDLQLKLLG